MQTRVDSLIEKFTATYTSEIEPPDSLLQELFDRIRESYNLKSIYVLENMPSKFEFRFSYMSNADASADHSGTVIICTERRYNERLQLFKSSRVTYEPLGMDELYQEIDYEDMNYGMLARDSVKWILGFTAEKGHVWKDEERAALTRLAAAIHGFLALKDNALYDSDAKKLYISAISKIFFASTIVDLQSGKYEAIHIAPWQVAHFPPKGDFDTLMRGLGVIVAPEYYEQYLNCCQLQPLYEYFAKGNTAFEISYRTKREKGIMWCRIVCYLYDKTKDGRPAHMLCLVEDISEQKQRDLEIEQALRKALEDVKQASRAKSSFLFNMSHDIRTPMNVILGFTDLAIENQRDGKLLGQYLDKIKISGQQLLDILNNVLEMARIENNKIVIEEELCEIASFWDRTFALFENEWAKKKFAVKIEEEIIHSHVYIDRVRMEQIFLNVMSNAVKYTPEGGSITIGVKELPGRNPGEALFEYSVTDTGIGMSDEFLQHVFESFARERNSTVSGIQGTGLGLSIVKSMVELMHGTVEVFSKQGRGTRIVIRIPHRIGEQERGDGGGAIAQSFRFEGRRVLLAEDNDLNAEIAEAILSRLGLEVERAADGVECLHKLEQAADGYYDFVLMDIQMPNMNGYKATQMIRSLDDAAKAAIPIFAMTANAFKEDEEKALAVGMNGHIAKPINVPKLKSVLAEGLCSSGKNNK